MLLKKLVLAAAAAFVIGALPALAGDTAPAKEAAKTVETAVFAVPGLKDEALVKNLTKALAKEAGVVSAKADAEGGKLMVTFEPAKTSPEALGKALAAVSPQAKFEKVETAGPAAAGHDCSKCPSRASCGKK